MNTKLLVVSATAFLALAALPAMARDKTVTAKGSRIMPANCAEGDSFDTAQSGMIKAMAKADLELLNFFGGHVGKYHDKPACMATAVGSNGAQINVVFFDHVINRTTYVESFTDDAD